ncbi:MAG TPA: DNA polymerase/3'-5' exonuclease PolX, partial [Actinomycetota bacterium]|nr:DNA polymerase/3'-5' exonuclease PolX [Actinomycetota bacterium]
MPRTNDAVEAVLLEYADLLSILTEEPHRPRSYEKAARAVGGYPADITEFEVKQLQAIPNVGSSIAGKIHEFLQTGSIGALEELRAQIPQGVRALTAIPGLGPKRAMILYEQLGVASVDELLAAVNEGRLAEIKGFGKRTADNILRSIQQMGSSERRVLASVALDVAEDLLRELNELKEVRRGTYAGSLRRMAETIGDVDLLVASAKPGPVMDRFVSLPVVDRVIAHGDAKSSVLTANGLQVDLRVIAEEAWGAGLMYFTGSKAHNIRLREMAIRKGLRLNEYGLFRVKSGKLIVAETEEEVYGRLGLPFIPPTLREDRGEIEAALAGKLPKVLEQKDVRGDLHTHTNLTDGLAPLEEMLEVAAAMRYAYYAVTDHAPQLFMQRMTDEKMLAQRDRLEALQATYPSMTLLHGSELNIDPRGGVDWPEEFLAGFDVLVASVHTHFNLSKDEMTRRIVRAMENPYVNILGHPTARLIGKRPPIEFDLEEVFRAAARTGTALEVNGFPDRLDLKDEHILWARRHGVKFAVDTDSHASLHLSHMRFGVATAQRGWLTKDDVINAWPLAKLRRFLD